jgi:hypothetical protein
VVLAIATLGRHTNGLPFGYSFPFGYNAHRSTLAAQSL